MPEPTTTTALALGTEAGKNLVTEVINAIKIPLTKYASDWRNSRVINKKINKLYERISTLRNVKTIWQIDKEVDLHSFYYPARTLNKKNKAVTVNDLSDIAKRL